MGKRKYKRMRTYGEHDGAYLSGQLLSSEAYVALPPTARTVLIFAIRQYMRASHGDTEDIEHTGFVFPYGDVAHVCSRGAYGQAMRELQDKGFLRRAPHLERRGPGVPHVWLPGIGWKHYRFTGAEKVRHDARRRSRERRAERDRVRRRELIHRIQERRRNPE